MDLVTQGLLGSNLALAGAKPETIRKAALIGLLAGLSADIDFFIRSDSDPLLNLEFHRHFSHSILFIPVAALVLSALLWPLMRTSFSWRRLFILCFLGYSLSGFLDACTSYGTSLLWPLSETRFSFNIISIIDPLFTLLLLTGLGWSIVTRRRRPALVFLALAAAYLSFGWVQKSRIEDQARSLARTQGHDIERLLVRPTLGNLLLWRSIYLSEGRYYVNAIRINPVTGASRVFRGGSIERFDPQRDSGKISATSKLGQDIRRFQRFTNDFLARDPAAPALITDVRYANLPDSVEPLWAIRIDPTRPQRHADYQVFHDTSQETRRTFMNMLIEAGD